MPKSRGRDKKTSTPDAAYAPKPVPTSPSWWAPVMVALMLFGLIWVVTFYISNQQYPLPQIGQWNLGIGFAFMLAGFMMTTRWK
ncbi:MAG: cell division protein CrgA [Actinomycetia bacterium]|nr:cell division protein CrgA [Actinomycetes bacterium]